MRIALCQFKNEGSIEENLKKDIQAIQEAKKNHADLVLFPEVHLTEFFPEKPGQNVEDYKVSIDSDIVKQFSFAAKENHISVVPNIYLEENGKCYDASLYIDNNGEILGIQKMVHVAQAHQFYEADYYTPSDTGFHVFDTPFGKIGIVVCFDRHYPESIRTEALMGVELILIPTVNIKAEPGNVFISEIVCQAFQNSVYIAMCNRVGIQNEMEFSGESIVVSPKGEVLLLADDQERILYFDIDIHRSSNIRKNKPYTCLRRKDLYL